MLTKKQRELRDHLYDAMISIIRDGGEWHNDGKHAPFQYIRGVGVDGYVYRFYEPDRLYMTADLNEKTRIRDIDSLGIMLQFYADLLELWMLNNSGLGVANAKIANL